MERAESPSPLQQVKRALPELNGAMQRVAEHIQIGRAHV